MFSPSDRGPEDANKSYAPIGNVQVANEGWAEYRKLEVSSFGGTANLWSNKSTAILW